MTHFGTANQQISTISADQQTASAVFRDAAHRLIKAFFVFKVFYGFMVNAVSLAPGSATVDVTTLTP
jgi:hypothetical protein